MEVQKELMMLWDIDDLLALIWKNTMGRFDLELDIEKRQNILCSKKEAKNEKLIYFTGKDKEL